MYYFAYGSNMSSKRLQARVPSAQFVALARLPGYQLTFRKFGSDGSSKCTIEPVPTRDINTVGVIYRIPAEQRYTLDRIEGNGFGYESQTVQVVTQDERKLDAFVYIGNDLVEEALPYSWYKQHVLIGAREHGIVDAYIDKICAVPSIDDPNEQRQRQELAIYQD